MQHVTVFNSKSKLIESIKADIALVVEYNTYTLQEICTLDNDDIMNMLEENGYTSPKVIYSYDAWEVVAGGTYNDYGADDLDFSDCKSSLECLNQEANEIMCSAWYSIASEQIDEYLENANELLELQSDS